MRATKARGFEGDQTRCLEPNAHINTPSSESQPCWLLADVQSGGGRPEDGPVWTRDLHAGLKLGSRVGCSAVQNADVLVCATNIFKAPPFTGCNSESVGRVPKLWRAYVGLDGDVSQGGLETQREVGNDEVSYEDGCRGRQDRIAGGWGLGLYVGTCSGLRDDADADMYGYKARIDADWETQAGVSVLCWMQLGGNVSETRLKCEE